MGVDRTKHARLSASGAYRWMECPGSVPLHELAVPDFPEDPTEYSQEGNSAHEVGATCLEDDVEAWDLIGQEFYGMKCTAAMAEAVQVYVDFCREITMSVEDHKDSFVEVETTLSDTGTIIIHPDFGGISDYAARSADDWLHIVDYKHGAGVPVDIVDPVTEKINVQLRYYGVGKLLDNQKVKKVRLSIVQPRITWYGDSVIRSIELEAWDLREWITELKTGMEAIDTDLALKPGSWCQFCPAKIACPVMQGMFKAATNASVAKLKTLTNSQINAEYGSIGTAKMYYKAIEDEMYRRCNIGEKGLGHKLVTNFGHRVFKKEAIPEIKEKFGDKAYKPAALKSPAQIEKLPGGGPYVKARAFKPNIGFTVVEDADPRAGVKAKSAVESFTGLTSTQPKD